jgi:carbonic anhydrase
MRSAILFMLVAAISAADHAAHSEASTVSSADALNRLAIGNAHFVAGKREVSINTGYDVAAREKTAQGQHPFAGILTCADSRLSPEIVFDQHLGDLFVVRNAGNIAEPVGEGSMEYGVAHLGISLIMVLGHSACGAVGAVGGSDDALPGNLSALQNEMSGLRQWVVSALAKDANKDAVMAEAVKVNAKRQAAAMVDESPALRAAIAAGKLKVVAAVYDLKTGVVSIVE